MAAINDGYDPGFRPLTKAWKDVKKNYTHFQNGDIGIAKISPCFENRKSVVFTSLENGLGAGTTELHILRPISNEFIDPIFWLWFFKSPYFIKQGCSHFMGAVGQQRMGQDVLTSILVPLPPKKIQTEIAEKLLLIMGNLAKIDRMQEDINRLSQTLKRKALSTVFSSDKSYYEIGKAGKLISGRDLSSSQYGNKGKTPYLTGASNFVHGTVQTNRYTDSPQVLSYEGDVLITCKGTIGKTAITPFCECHIARQIMAFRCGETMINEYCKYFLMAKASDLQWASSSLIPGFDRNDFLGLKYPHKTIGEQKRICHTLNKMFSTIDFIVEDV